MPHYTRSGDDETSLWGGGRVPKHHPQPEAYGAVDEATSALGLARALAVGRRSDAVSVALQHQLYLIMAELAVAPGKPTPEDFRTTAEHVAELERQIAEIEAEVEPPKEFVLPGASPAAGAMDLARAIVRRAERDVSRLGATEYELNPEILRYLNRASSLLFSLARYEEAAAGEQAPRAAEGGA